MSSRERIRQFMVTNFYLPDPSVLADDTSLLDAGVIDSTGVLEVIAFLEESFSIAVEEEETTPENLDSIARIAAYVARKHAANKPQSQPQAQSDVHQPVATNP